MENISIAPAKKEQINQLNIELQTNIPNFHETKIAEQESGNSLWLIAWANGKAIGHLQVRFNGPTEKDIKTLLNNVNDFAHIESIGVKENEK